jgi:hypothetical protein
MCNKFNVTTAAQDVRESAAAVVARQLKAVTDRHDLLRWLQDVMAAHPPEPNVEEQLYQVMSYGPLGSKY